MRHRQPDDDDASASRSTGIVPGAVAAGLTIVLTALHPIGYVGGGGDDYRYLTAARCFAEHGLCLPHDHWWRRYPIVLPEAASLRVFGESAASLAVVPLLYALAAVILLTAVVQRRFGSNVALVAGVVFAATPVIVKRTLEIGIGVPELVFVLAAIWLLDRPKTDCTRAAVFGAGLMLGMAIQCRPTALAMVPVFVGGLLAVGRWRDIALFAAAALVPNVAEAAVYAAATGDPLWPWKLSLAHTAIPSTELSPLVDPGRSPLFNPDFIGGWRREMGVHVHWSIDGLLNLLVDPEIGLTLLAAAAMAVIARPRAPLLWWLAGIAAWWFATLTYGLAVDPKPRMFLVVAAVASTIFAVAAAERWRTNRAFATIAVALIVLKGAIASLDRPSVAAAAMLAPIWISGHERNLAVDPTTASLLTLVPAVRALPTDANATGSTKLLLVGETDCAQVAVERGYAGWPVRRAASFRTTEPHFVTALRRRHILLAPQVAVVMCILARPA